MQHLLLLRDCNISRCTENNTKQTVLTPQNAQYYKVVYTASTQLTWLTVLC